MRRYSAFYSKNYKKKWQAPLPQIIFTYINIPFTDLKSQQKKEGTKKARFSGR